MAGRALNLPAHDKMLVNWDVVDDELERISHDYKQPKFYSLSHVVEILSSVDPQGLVSQLRDQSERLEALVDSVVLGYHSGFAKSIQNYSQILHLFTESKDQVDTLKKSLSEASRHLAAQSRHLHQQWKKSIQLASSMRLLEDIQRVVETPKQIEAALANKDWPTAVSILLRGCSKLAQEEMMKVGALRKLCSEMGSICKVIQDQVLDELHARIYSHHLASSSSSASTSLSQAQDLEGDSQELTLKNRDQAEPWFPTPEAAAAAATVAKRRAAHRKASAQKGRRPEELPSPRAHAGEQRVVSSSELVQCLVQIGSLNDAKVYISMRTRAEIRKLIIRTLEHLAAVHSSSSGSQGAATNGPHQVTIPRHAAFTAQRMVTAVFENCVKALRNMGAILKEVASAPTVSSSAGLQLLRAQFSAATGGDWGRTDKMDSLLAMGHNEYMRSEFGAVWEEMQEECQLLLAELLHAPLRSLRSTDAAQKQAAGWLAEFEKLGERAFGKGAVKPGAPEERSSRLTFTFEVTVAGLQVDRAWEHKEALPADNEVASYSKLVAAVLGSHSGTMYLTPAIYQPVTKFVDSSVSVLGAMAGEGGKRIAAGGDSKTQLWLRQFVEDFVVETFLPQVWVDLRGRCTAALEDADAFKPIVAFGQSGSSRPILLAARFAEQMLGEVVSWASSMPFFASSLTGVVENILGRILEGFQAAVADVVGNSKSAKLAARSDVGMLMVNEQEAQLLDSQVAFYVPKSAENFDAASFVLGLQGTGMEADTAETEVLQLMFRERPNQAEQLLALASPHRLVQLAALGESLDYVADTMLRLAGGSAKDGSGSKDKHKMRKQQKVAGAAASGNEVMLGAMEHLRDRYKALAGQCIRALRIEMLLLCSFHLHQLALVSHVCEEEDVREVHHAVGALTRAVTRAAEEAAPYLAPAKKAYVFGCVASAATKTIMWLLPEITEINGLGVERMVRTLSVMQPILATLGQAPGEPIRPEMGRLFDRARTYYTLVTIPVDEMLKIATDKPQRYNPAEWVALLQVQVPGRLVYDSHFSHLRRVMDRAYGNTASQKVAAAFDQLRNSLVVAPAEQLRAATEQLTAGIQNSAQQIQGFFKGAVTGARGGR